jgi:hypothetical protein
MILFNCLNLLTLLISIIIPISSSCDWNVDFGISPTGFVFCVSRMYEDLSSSEPGLGSVGTDEIICTFFYYGIFACWYACYCCIDCRYYGSGWAWYD